MHKKLALAYATRKSKIVIECLLDASHWGYSNEEGRDSGG